jgi:hypothetical protein
MALIVAAGACGNIITVPDQGLIVTGCQLPAQCWKATCDCNRGKPDTTGDHPSQNPLLDLCTTPCQLDPFQPGDCECNLTLPTPVNDMLTSEPLQCIEVSQACIGRGVFCGGVGAKCVQVGSTCDGGGDPPMLIPTVGMPGFEPHCQFADDVCCPGTTPTDGGVPD